MHLFPPPMRVVWAACLMLLGSSTAPAQNLRNIPPAGGGALGEPPTDAMTAAEHAAIEAQLEASRRQLIAAGKLSAEHAVQQVEFEWPLKPADDYTDPGYHGISNNVDQDTGSGIKDYSCESRTYNGHRGTDYFLWPFSWYMMDHDRVEIVAAAPGVIISKSDGNFDRSCVQGGGTWNAVYVQNMDGSISWYGHMKTGTLTARAVGDTVETGEYLGLVGSSGNSSGPHLHFETYNINQLIDPYAGECNTLNDASWWADQRPYRDSAINALMTQDAPPEFPQCPQQEVPHAVDHFDPGQSTVWAAYYRDQLKDDRTTYRIRMPDGTIWQEWIHDAPETYNASYWWWRWTLPENAPVGTWQWEAEYKGQIVTRAVTVGNPNVGIEDEPSSVNGAVELHANYPNPFANQTEIRFDLPASTRVDLAVYDLLGRRVAQLASGRYAPGSHARLFDTSNLPSGVYVYTIETELGTLSRRLSVAR